ASELQRALAEHGLEISLGKMSNLWSGQPASLKLDDLDVICVGWAVRSESCSLPSLTRSSGLSTRVGRTRPHARRRNPCGSFLDAVTGVPCRRPDRWLPETGPGRRSPGR